MAHVGMELDEGCLQFYQFLRSHRGQQALSTAATAAPSLEALKAMDEALSNLSSGGHPALVLQGPQPF